MKKKVMLIIRDGWGYRKNCEENAVCETKTPFTDEYMNNYPTTLLDASGKAVGLPKGTQGNSEVGHMTIGSGRIIYQSLVRINESIEKGEYEKNTALLGAIENCKKNNSTFHIMGLLQSEAVHSHENHLLATLEICKKNGLKSVMIHPFTDGRDAPITDGLKHIKKLQKKIDELGIGQIATISGRYYSMDRDQRWERTKKAYDCIVNAESEEVFEDIIKTVEECYKNKETDEFIKPKKLSNYEGIKQKDSVFFFNFRTDRTRQLTKAIVEKEFEGWDRSPLDVYYLAMTEFYKPMNAHVIFKDIKLDNLLGPVISDAGLHQLRISETEKYAHVTFFFNGQVEKPAKNEERALVHSPKVATYDLQPEMSVFEISKKLTEEINKNKYEFIVTNLVNGDLVGHTGITNACHKAVTSVDKALHEIVEAGLKNDYTILVFADHGNIEDQTAEWRTSHTINPVPLILISNELKNAELKSRLGLKDIAPTVLDILEIKQPVEMTGETIIEA